MSAASNPPLRVGTIWMFDLQQPPVKISPLPQVTFRRIEGDSAALLLESLEAPVVVEFQRRLASGRRCYTAWAGETLAGYGWVSFIGEEVGELGLHLQLQPCEPYIWDCYTLPDFRNRHIYAALLMWILQSLADEGLCRAWIGADVDNVPSQRGIDRAGFTRVADLLVSQEGSQRSIWAEGYPGVPEDLVSEARRVYLGSLEVLHLENDHAG